MHCTSDTGGSKVWPATWAAIIPPATPSPPAAAAPVSWRHLVAIEPRLQRLEQQARRAGRDWQSWERVKGRLSLLVGWSAARLALRTDAAWQVAHNHLLQLWESPRQRAAR